MRPIKYITSVEPTINVILLISLLSIVFMESWLNSVPEFFSWGAEFGRVYFKICLSIVSSYIFYFFVVHIKSIKDKENISFFVSKKVKNIIWSYKSQIDELKKEADFSTEKSYLELDEVQNILKSIDPNGKAPLVINTLGNYGSWKQYFEYHTERSQAFIKKIFVKMPFLDSKLVRLLSNIDDCSHFMSVDLMKNMVIRKQSMEGWAKSFYEYSIYCKDLEIYYNKELIEN